MSSTPKIATREAGRELDALIAERVFGWTVNRSESHWHTVGETGRERHILIGRDCCADKYQRGAFCPSQNIADAWRVVDKMRAPAGRGELALGEDRRPGRGPWFCRFMGGSGYAEAETAPLAICLAALEAVATDAPESTTP